MKNNVCFALLLTLCHICKAQPPMYKAADDSRENRRKSEASLNAVYEANLPNPKTSSRTSTPFVWDGPVPYLLQTKAERAADAKASAEREQRIYEANKANRLWEEKKLSDAIAFKDKICFDKFDAEKKAGTILTDLDLLEYTQWNYADTYGGTTYISTANKSLNKLREYYKDSANGSFDFCINTLIGARIFANTCFRELEKLKEKFPDKIEEIEKQQLFTMGYIFGAFIPNYVRNNNDMVYPKCQYELASNSNKIILLNNFLSYYYKYPTFTRKNFNPFLLVANFNSNYGNTSNELRFNMHKLVLLSKPPTFIKDTYTRVFDKFYLLKNRCEESAIYLRKYYPIYIATLSPTEWINIAKVQDASLDDILEIFEFNDSKKSRKKSFIHFKNATKGNLELEIKDGFHKIEVAEYTYFEGIFENGKPNGLGKLESNTIIDLPFKFEGIFKNGHLTKLGTYTDLKGKELNRTLTDLDLENNETKSLFIIKK
jgi:hypothetical protein